MEVVTLNKIVCLMILNSNEKASLIGIFLNTYNIFFLVKNRHGINLSVTFTNLLILLAVFDTLFLITGIGLFGLPAVSAWYRDNLFNKILPNG